MTVCRGHRDPARQEMNTMTICYWEGEPSSQEIGRGQQRAELLTRYRTQQASLKILFPHFSLTFPVCLSVCLSVFLSVCISICLSAYFPGGLSVFLSNSSITTWFKEILFPVYLLVCLSVCPSVCLSVSLSVCNYISGTETWCIGDYLSLALPLLPHAICIIYFDIFFLYQSNIRFIIIILFLNNGVILTPFHTIILNNNNCQGDLNKKLISLCSANSIILGEF